MKRYEGEGLEEYPDGDWVKYEDVKKLEDCIERCEKMIKGCEVTGIFAFNTKEFNEAEGALLAYKDILKLLKGV